MFENFQLIHYYSWVLADPKFSSKLYRFLKSDFGYTESKTYINMDCYCFYVHVNVLYVKKIFSIFMHSQTFRGFLVDNLSFTGKEAFAQFQDRYLM